MSNDLNTVALIGRMTRDPETRQARDKTVANFSLANGRSWKDQSGAKQEETSFIDCVAWGKLAEIVGQYGAKGKQVAVTGRLQQNRWQDKDGNNRARVEVVASSLQLLSSPQSGGGSIGTDAPDTAPLPAEEDIPF